MTTLSSHIMMCLQAIELYIIYINVIHNKLQRPSQHSKFFPKFIFISVYILEGIGGIIIPSWIPKIFGGNFAALSFDFANEDLDG